MLFQTCDYFVIFFILRIRRTWWNLSIIWVINCCAAVDMVVDMFAVIFAMMSYNGISKPCYWLLVFIEPLLIYHSHDLWTVCSMYHVTHTLQITECTKACVIIDTVTHETGVISPAVISVHEHLPRVFQSQSTQIEKVSTKFTDDSLVDVHFKPSVATAGN